VMASPQAWSVERLALELEHQSISVANLPPVWLTQGTVLAGHALRLLIVGGDALAPMALRAVAPSCRVLNAYGPTEATVTASLYDLGDAATRPASTTPLVPIGRPMDNRRLYVLDRQLNPVPPGVAGELYIGGSGLARGYRQQPALSAERFVPDPFGPEPGARLYRSGDAARHLPDGSIEYLGRMDRQLKLRGVRIEPGEIESALCALPGVREAAVVLREDRPGERRLVGYVVTGEEPAATPSALLSALRRHLPEPMLPALLVPLPALPLSPNGKLDRGALPAPADAQPPAVHVAPATPTEIGIAEIWASLLDRPRIGLHDDFFALGGHSLLATQVVSRVQARFGIQLPLRELFSLRTVAELAALVDEYAALLRPQRDDSLEELEF
jgi:acyl-CoA synthetase (AMP-forming)/AMP-acid ligase II/acyl carrier protein